jgi:hypothetical protein
MVKANKWRSKSMGPRENPNPSQKKHKHLQQRDLLNENDKKEL